MNESSSVLTDIPCPKTGCIGKLRLDQRFEPDLGGRVDEYVCPACGWSSFYPPQE